MPDISPEIMMIIEWGIVPLILIGILAHFLVNIPAKDASDAIKRSSNSGKFAGFIIFALFVLSQRNRELLFSFNIPVYEFDFLLTGGSILAGCLFSWIFKSIKTKKIIGLYTLFMVVLTTVTLYGYLFIQNLRSYIIFITMGAILGILIFAIFYPKELTAADNKD